MGTVAGEKLSGDLVFWNVMNFFRLVVMGPPFAPGFRVSAKGSAGNGLQGGVHQVLSLSVKRVVIQEIQKLRNGGQALFAGEHAGTRQISGRALANLLCGIMGQNGKQRVDRFLGAQHGQAFHCPEARQLIRITRITDEQGQDLRRLDAAIAQGAKSPESEGAAAGIALNLMAKLGEALR